MKRSELEAEAKRRAKRDAIWMLIYSILCGISASINADSCDSNSMLLTYSCPSESTVFLTYLVSILISVVFIGLPLMYITYGDTKWFLFGYETALKGKTAKVYSLFVTIPVVCEFLSVELPLWAVLIYYATLYVLLVYKIVQFSKIKKQYEDDTLNKKFPKMEALESLLEEEKAQQASTKKAKVETAKEQKEGNKQDDGLDDEEF